MWAPASAIRRNSACRSPCGTTTVPPSEECCHFSPNLCARPGASSAEASGSSAGAQRKPAEAQRISGAAKLSAHRRACSACTLMNPGLAHAMHAGAQKSVKCHIRRQSGFRAIPAIQSAITVPFANRIGYILSVVYRQSPCPLYKQSPCPLHKQSPCPLSRSAAAI